MSKTKYEIKGHITVFLSLILTLILSVVCTTIESARLQGARMQLQNITDMGIYSVFAEYNKDLLEQYDLFFTDMGYGTSDGTKERVNERMKEFITYNTNVTKDLEALQLLRYSEVWKARVNNVETDQYVLSTDRHGKAYYSQAITYMEHELGILLVKNLLSQYDESIVDKQEEFKLEKNNEDTMLAEIEDKKSAHQAEYDAQLEEAKGDESKVTIQKPTSVSNPVDTIKSLQASPILDLVVEDPSSISDKKITDKKQLASKRTLKTGTGTFQAKEDNPLNRALFNEYLFEKFPNYCSEDTNDSDVLSYQMEYILGGKDSDKKNLENVVSKLLLMREGINFSYLMLDGAKRTEAFELAGLIVGYLGAAAIAVLAIVIMLAWAFAESVIEVRMLLEGKKVALIKNADNWKLGLSNLANLPAVIEGEEEEDDSGIDYEGYLKLLVYFSNTNKKIDRSLDLIELTIQKSNENFRIDNCIQSFQTTVQYEVSGLFLRMPFQTLERGSDGYQYHVTRDFSYYD